jgi:hypothetical protein
MAIDSPAAMDTPSPYPMITPLPGSFGSLGAITGTTGGSYPAPPGYTGTTSGAYQPPVGYTGGPTPFPDSAIPVKS